MLSVLTVHRSCHIVSQMHYIQLREKFTLNSKSQTQIGDENVAGSSIIFTIHERTNRTRVEGG